MSSIVPTTSRETDDAARMEQVAKKQKEYKLIGRRRKIPGHTLFEFNVMTKELRHAMVKHDVIFDTKSGKPIYKNKAEVHEGCLYVQALNKQNAEKKLKRIGAL